MQHDATVAKAPPPGADFRAAAAEQSERVPLQQGDAVLLDAPSSLCLKMPGDPTLTLYRVAVVPWAWMAGGTLLFLFGLVLAILILTPWVDATFWSVGSAVVAVVAGPVMFLFAAADESVFRRALTRRLGRRMEELESRVAARYPFAVEDPATYQKQKVISEDYAFGGLDRHRPGLLLDGLRYRYVIRPADVTGVREDKDYLLITYTVRGAPLTLALTLLLGEPEEERRVLRAVRTVLLRE